MSSDPDQSSSGADARDNRRWLIGVSISVAFGLFGVIMALLSYSQSRPVSAPAAVGNAPASKGAAAEPARQRRSKGDRRN